jgi:signal transduction histidine kinase
MLAAYTVAERRQLAVAAAGGAMLAAGIAVHDLASPEYDSVSGIVSDIVVPILVWGLGRIVHFQNNRAERSEGLVQQLEADREELARAAVAAERSHLARELHDVVTHSISVAVIQAQGAQRALDPDQPDVRQALQDIEQVSRTALTEMRRLLGLLRADAASGGPAHEPLPGLASLPALVAQVGAAGLTVELVGDLEVPDGDPGTELSIYRIVQEALTNTIRYAPDSRVIVRLARDVDALRVCITDDGRGASEPPGSGRGLLGMRERVTVHGGTLETGPIPGGGFQVQARLPIGGGVP